MNKNELDEMQVQVRNKIGNQTLSILFYLLLIDMGLYGFGVKWLKYPLNVFIIMMACMTYYLIRIIGKNAFVGPRIKSKTISLKVICVMAVSVVISLVTVLLLNKKTTLKNSSGNSDNGALILFIVSIVALIIIGVISLVKKKQNKD